MTELFDFLTDLAVNPGQQQAFAKEPDAIINALSLSESERSALKSGNHDRVAAVFAEKHFQAAISFADPAPDPMPDPDPPEPEPPDSDSPEEAQQLLALVV